MKATRVRALRVRLDPDDVQAGLMLRRAGARRAAYNFAVEVLRHNGATWRRQADAGMPREGRVKVPSHFDLIRRWTGADGLPAARDLVCRDRHTGEPWWDQHPAQMFEAALKDARENYGKHLRGEARPPRFLALRRDLPRFRARTSVKLVPGQLSFQGSGGWLRVAHAGMTTKKPGLGARGRGCNRAITDQGFGELRRQITYKADGAGVGLLLAPRFFPSSKTCGACRTVRLKLSLDERIYLCGSCGHTDDRDLNAARNLAAWGETELGIIEPTDSTDIQDGDRDPRGPAATPGDGEPMWHACGPASAGHRETTLGMPKAVVVGGGTGRDEAGTRQPTASQPRRQRGTSRTGTSTTRRDEPITTRS